MPSVPDAVIALDARASSAAGAAGEDGVEAVRRRLDHLRQPVIQRNLRLRHAVRRAASQYLDSEGFLELETPVLGPRVDEYPAGHVVAHLEDGTELWLAQSPQLLKQMFIATGYGRYFQFAHCFRDEPRSPGRHDHLREFVQLDLEMETTSAAEVRRTVEGLVRSVLAAVGIDVATPFPEIDAVECVERYGTDRPDLRTRPDEYAFLWVNEFPLLQQGDDGSLYRTRHPMALPTAVPGSLAEARTLRTHSYDLVLNGNELASGDLRISSPDRQRHMLELLGEELSSLDDLVVVLEQCPPHGGLGMGLDRLVMRLTGSDSVKDACAFPDLLGF